MTRVPYDQAAKALLQTALTTLGRAEVQHEVPPGEPAWVDVLFEPGPSAPFVRETLLLRLMGTGRTLREAVREARSIAIDAWEHRPAVAALSVLRFRLDSIEPVDEERRWRSPRRTSSGKSA
jgi:hypothetical protein